MTNVTFEERIAYEIGVKLAHEAYMEKEASWQAAKTLGSGLMSVAKGGQGAQSVSQAFRQGAGGQGFKAVMGDIGAGLKKPWQDMYRTYGARSGRNQILQKGKEYSAAKKQLAAATQSGDQAAIQAAQTALTKAKDARITTQQNVFGSFGNRSNLTAAANKSYIPRNSAGQVDYGQLGTMATGVGLAGTGAYMAGNAAFGGGNTYVNNTTQVAPQPQVAPHQYYLNQLSSYFGGKS